MHDVDVVVVGGGHNGMVAAAYLARAGRSVRVLERRDELGGAAVSGTPFAGVDVRLSRYSYLVSLLPQQIIDDLALDVVLRRRRVSSYTPIEDDGLLDTASDRDRASDSFVRITGGTGDFPAWQRFQELTRHVARRVFPTMTGPLPSKEQLRAEVADDHAWQALFIKPLSEVIESNFGSDIVRGVVLTDGLIGTFATADEESLRQNRCFLYHVIGNGTGEWKVPVGGMGAVSAALAAAARQAGAKLCTNSEVLAIDPAGEVRYRHADTEHVLHARHVLVNVAPHVLARLLGQQPGDPCPEGAQLKINMVLRRLPRLRDPRVDPHTAFGGTLHVNEGYGQLAEAHAQARSGRIPSLPPCEVYCHSLTDDSILGPAERSAGAHTMTLFGLHMPVRLFRDDNESARAAAVAATLNSLNQVLAEPIQDCFWTDGRGNPCIEAKTPVDLELELGMPGGHIFHRDLAWPYAEDPRQAGSWGVETEHERILLCGAGAVRGGGVSGIGGHNAAMAVLHRESGRHP